MMKVVSDQNYITTMKIVNYDINGDPEVQLEVNAGPKLLDIETRLTNAEKGLNEMRQDRIQNNELRQKNPALQDLYEKYQVMLCLLKEHELEHAN